MKRKFLRESQRFRSDLQRKYTESHIIRKIQKIASYPRAEVYGDTAGRPHEITDFIIDEHGHSHQHKNQNLKPLLRTALNMSKTNCKMVK